VATFIGTPTMNLVRGTLETAHGRAVFRAVGLELELSPAEQLREHVGAEITVGIRPECLGPGVGEIRGRLDVVEHMGSESIIYLSTDAGRIVAKAPPDWLGEIGASVSLSVKRAGLHFFRDGRRIPAQFG
jgi:multiple sugar transport system ATP-binding protein